MKFKIGDKVIYKGKECVVEEVFDHDRSYIIEEKNMENLFISDRFICNKNEVSNLEVTDLITGFYVLVNLKNGDSKILYKSNDEDECKEKMREYSKQLVNVVNVVSLGVKKDYRGSEISEVLVFYKNK